MVGEGRNNKERVKLFFIQNEQNLENGKNKREVKKERRKRSRVKGEETERKQDERKAEK